MKYYTNYTILGVCQKTGRTHVHALNEPIPDYIVGLDDHLLDRLSNMKGLEPLDPTKMTLVYRDHGHIDVCFKRTNNVILMLSPRGEYIQ